MLNTIIITERDADGGAAEIELRLADGSTMYLHVVEIEDDETITVDADWQQELIRYEGVRFNIPIPALLIFPVIEFVRIFQNAIMNARTDDTRH
jgi:hypothetical protein